MRLWRFQAKKELVIFHIYTCMLKTIKSMLYRMNIREMLTCLKISLRNGNPKEKKNH
jgi:hypothetical protein